MAKIITTTPVIEIGEVSAKVPMYRSLYVAQAVLNSSITFEPIKALGNPPTIRPIVGAKTYFTLIADGSTYPAFSADFKRTRDSLNYNPTLGMVNLVSFTYDGVDFKYSITPAELYVEYPRWVGNFGLGPDVMLLVAHDDAEIVIQYTDPPVARRCAFNLIKSLHYIGTNPILYSLSKDGAHWVSNVDPKLAELEFSCAEVGQQTVYIKAGEVGSSMETPVVTIHLTPTDSEGYCTP
jgi:hypothetical protein